MSNNTKQDMNIMKLMEKYHKDDSCREVLSQLRWPNGIACPRCGSMEIRNSYTRDQYDCVHAVINSPLSQVRYSMIVISHYLSGL